MRVTNAFAVAGQSGQRHIVLPLSSVLYIADSIMLEELFGEANPHLPQCPDDIVVLRI
jgi:hypothetical protein